MASDQAASTPQVRCECPSFLKESVLTLDGGGIRGYASLLIVEALMKEVLHVEHDLDREAQYDHDCDDQLPLPCYYFNYMFGTSTGGIIALLLGRMRLSVPQCLDIYRDLGTDIFRSKRAFGLRFNQYSHHKLERIVKKTILTYCRDLENSEAADDAEEGEDGQSRGNSEAMSSGQTTEDWEDCADLEDLHMFDPSLQQPTENIAHFAQSRVGLVATRRTENSSREHLFRSYRNPTPISHSNLRGGAIVSVEEKIKLLNLDKQDDGERPIKIWEAARATSAAPHYFKRIRIDTVEYMDGGVSANNPSMTAWYEVNSMHSDNAWGCRAQQGCIRFLVSLGTGIGAASNLFSDGNMLHQVHRILHSALQNMTNPEKEHINMRQMCDTYHPDTYYRFNVQRGLENMRLDACEVSKSRNITLEKIAKEVRRYVRAAPVREELKSLARMLVEHRRSKCRPSHRRYQGLSTSGPLSPVVAARYRDLDDIRACVPTAIDTSPHSSTTSRPSRLSSHKRVDTPCMSPTLANNMPPHPGAMKGGRLSTW